MAIPNKEKRQLTITLGTVIITWNTVLWAIYFFEEPSNKHGVLGFWIITDTAMFVSLLLWVTAHILFPRSKDHRESIDGV